MLNTADKVIRTNDLLYDIHVSNRTPAACRFKNMITLGDVVIHVHGTFTLVFVKLRIDFSDIGNFQRPSYLKCVSSPRQAFIFLKDMELV